MMGTSESQTNEKKRYYIAGGNGFALGHLLIVYFASAGKTMKGVLA